MLVVHVMVGRGKASAQVGAAEGAVARRRLGRADRVGGGNAQRRHEQQQQRSASHGTWTRECCYDAKNCFLITSCSLADFFKSAVWFWCGFS